MVLGVVADHLVQLQPVEVRAGHRGAEQSAAFGHGEGDQFGGGALGGEDEVALVLATLVVDDDDRPAGRDLRDRVLDGVERLPGVADRVRGRVGGGRARGGGARGAAHRNSPRARGADFRG